MCGRFRLAEDSETLYPQIHRGSCWCSAQYVPLCREIIDITATSNRAIARPRGLILSPFSSFKHQGWTLLPEKISWHHSEGVCVTEPDVLAQSREGPITTSYHGYQIKWPQKCLSAQQGAICFLLSSFFFLSPFAKTRVCHYFSHFFDMNIKKGNLGDLDSIVTSTRLARGSSLPENLLCEWRWGCQIHPQGQCLHNVGL